MDGLTTKLRLLAEANDAHKRASEALDYAEHGLRAHEQEFAEMMLRVEALNLVSYRNLYLVGRQLHKCLSDGFKKNRS
jgi:hypothetical protein